jgi:hypothetical protein
MKLTRRYEKMTPEKRPQDPSMDGTGLTFETLEHGGEYPDTMPQAIRLTDAEGRSCIYVPITQDGKAVDSEGFRSIRRTNGDRLLRQSPLATPALTPMPSRKPKPIVSAIARSAGRRSICATLGRY